ncbi:phosphatase 2C-like domain-containing protein [Pavlovales sp. CCMP2436]|nr:phosphatase 2C-like domain-containing protein [Pavlovales sp. CCMP2436]|mmetsp:Transcript_42172/g.97840  ORF Transcript_42172/g.97840 Transcript_42172/m.97840 type:complete len:300 (-) Transcript_42172:228-1127(-)
MLRASARARATRYWLPALTFAVPRRLCSASAVRVEFGIASLPDPSKKRGEDAHIISCPPPPATRAWAGVFDGVGGWASSGVDPSKYSRELARLVDLELHQQVAGGEPSDLREALHAAASANAQIGSCTACIAAVCTDGRISTLNVGDSGVWVLRRREDAAEPAESPVADAPPAFSLVHRSQVQQHAFNTPFQLGTQSRDSAADGELGSFAGVAGDMVLLASDGLFDNLSELDIRILVSEFSATPAQKIAETLAWVAQKVSFDENRRSPFEVEAKRHGFNFKGGKVDDTTVLVLKLVADR